MKFFRAYLRQLALAFSLLLFFQSCTVYKTKSTSLIDQVYKKPYVQIVMNDSAVLQYKGLRMQKNEYYGVISKKPYYEAKMPAGAFSKIYVFFPFKLATDTSKATLYHGILLENNKVFAVRGTSHDKITYTRELKQGLITDVYLQDRGLSIFVTLVVSSALTFIGLIVAVYLLFAFSHPHDVI